MTWQQYFVALFLVARLVGMATMKRVPDDYFHPGWRAARGVVFAVFILALWTGGFWHD